MEGAWWSHDNGELLLVYEYMSNGSLDQHLFSSAPGSRPGQALGWELRYSIVQGVASALHYLHDQFDQRIVHRDLKASNIMLDAAFTARLGDFGLARAFETDKTSYMEEAGGGVHGTVGYIAPSAFTPRRPRASPTSTPSLPSSSRWSAVAARATTSMASTSSSTGCGASTAIAAHSRPSTPASTAPSTRTTPSACSCWA
ncbi:hypothetical protein ZWY2020_042604 [Hordeum vulgare]|nr:hypothetical protein ZWY2020_042604 [Hordeum vulgare]